MAEEKKKKRETPIHKGHEEWKKRDPEAEREFRGKIGMQMRDIMASGVGPAAEFLVKVIESPEYSDDLKAKCSMYLFDRLLGKPGITVDADVDSHVSISISDELKQYAK